MEPQDRQKNIDYYEKLLQVHGYSPLSLDMGKDDRRDVRFSVLAKYALQSPASSVLDVGCGFADLYDFLTLHGWQGKYTGVDISPRLLAVAQQRHPDLTLIEMDISSQDQTLEKHDFVIAPGIFSAKMDYGNNQTYIADALTIMHRLANVAVCADFLSSYVDYQKPLSWHTDPGWLMGIAKQITPRVILRHDYMPYEFALFLFADSTISERKVFQAFEPAPPLS